MKPSDLLLDLGRPVAYYPGLVKYLGSVNAVLLFCQIMYWTGKEKSEFGIYKSAAEFEWETGLSVQEQRTARKCLRERGVLVEIERKLEHRIYYKLDTDRLNELMSANNGGTANQQPGSEESTSAECNINIGETANQHPYIHRLLTETTAEITPETQETKEGKKEELTPLPSVATLTVGKSEKLEPPLENESEPNQTPTPKRPALDKWEEEGGTMEDIQEILYSFFEHTHIGAFDLDACELAADLLNHWGMDNMEEAMKLILVQCPKTAGVAWKDFQYFHDNFERTLRNARAWERKYQATLAAKMGR